MLEATYAMERGVLPFIGFAHFDVSDRPWPWLSCKESLWKGRMFLLFWRRRTILPWQLPVQWFWQIGIPSTIMQKANASRKGISKKLSCCESIFKSDLFYISSSHQFSRGGEKRILIFYYWFFLTKSVMIDMVVVQTHEICQWRNWCADKLVIVTIIDYFVPKK